MELVLREPGGKRHEASLGVEVRRQAGDALVQKRAGRAERTMTDDGTDVERTTIILHSGDMDKLYSALIIGNGALAMGMEAYIYFTFWGLQRLKKGELEKGPLSKMHMMGVGKRMIEGRMEAANVRSLRGLIEDFKELGGHILACDMTMEIMGIEPEELDQELIDEYCAVGTYIQAARDSTVTLFI
jgi:peroxiredoxin family protein